MRRIALLGLAIVVVGAASGRAHEGHAPAGPADSARPPGESQVKIEERDGYRVITSNGIPDHPTGRFPGPGNPNTIRAQAYTFRVPLKPMPADGARRPERSGGRTLFGVALNGVVFDPGTAEWWDDDPRAGWNYEAIGGSIDLGLDKSNAHVQPTGAYHYHGPPAVLIERLRIAGKDKQMTLVGWAADGYPIYAGYGYTDARNLKSDVRKLRPSYRLKSGTRPSGRDGPGGKYDGTFTADFEFVDGLGDLDASNGRNGITPEFPGGTYYYVLTDSFPHVPRQFHGVPDDSFRKERGPGGRRGGPPPPRGGGRRPPPPAP
jgi:hypothetical protein